MCMCLYEESPGLALQITGDMVGQSGQIKLGI